MKLLIAVAPDTEVLYVETAAVEPGKVIVLDVEALEGPDTFDVSGLWPAPVHQGSIDGILGLDVYRAAKHEWGDEGDGTPDAP